MSGTDTQESKNPQSTTAWIAAREEFLVTGDVTNLQEALTRAADESAAKAYRAAIGNVAPCGVAMLAAGAHGRGDIYPYSGLEIILLTDSAKEAAAVKELLPEFVRLLWNAGLRVNSTVACIHECCKSIEQARGPALSLLGRRFLLGDRAIHETLEQQLPDLLSSRSQPLIEALCQTARERHTRYRDTPYHAEPDVKHAPGGLADWRLAGLLASFKPDLDAGGDELKRAGELMAAVRCYLHYRAACDDNLLSLEAQRYLAQQAFAGSDCTRRYFASARTIFNAARSAMDGAEKSRGSLLDNFRDYRSRLSNQDFTVVRGQLLLRNPPDLAKDASLIMRTIEFVGRHGVEAAADTRRRLEASLHAFAAWCGQQKALWPAVKSIVSSPHAGLALRLLQSTGLMGALFPEWAGVEFQVDSEYRYTLGEQALRTIESVLEMRSEDHPERQRFGSLLNEVDDLSVLLFALLLSKSRRHYEAIAHVHAPEDAQHLLELLIEHQSDLADAAGGRDLDDPATARSLANRAGTVERLRMLALVAYARIASGSAEAQLSWRLDRLWRLYGVIRRELVRELETDRIQQLPADLPRNAEFIKGFPSRYLHAHSAAEIEAHVELFERSRPTGVAARLDPIEGAWRLTVVARDKPALFASFAGAISSFGMDILKAEAFSNTGRVVLDTFVFADPKGMLRQNPNEAERLIDLIGRVALGKTDVLKLMRGRALPETGKRTAAAEVQFDSEACPTATLVEIATEDRPGLLYSLANVFSSSACNIDVVLVDTKGRRAIDVFYIAQEGHKLTPEAQAALRNRLLAAC